MLPPVSRCRPARIATWSRSRVVHALDDDLERLVERHAELLVGDDAAELALRRLGGVVDDDRERAHEAVPRPQRRGEHVEVVGQLLGERPSLRLSLRLT